MPGALAASLPMGAAHVVWRTPRLTACLAEAATLHRHLCPRQALGVRMGLYASELLGIEFPRPDERLFVFVETDLLRAERGASSDIPLT